MSDFIYFILMWIRTSSKCCNCKRTSYLVTGLSRLTSSALRSGQTLLQRKIKLVSTHLIRIIVQEEILCYVKGNWHSPGIQVDQQVPARLSHQQLPIEKRKTFIKCTCRQC